MKNKIILLLLLFCSITTSFYAQDRGDKNDRNNRSSKFNYEQFRQQKAKFFVKEIGLTEDEAKAFLPLEEELMSKKFELNKGLRKAGRELRQKKERTEAAFEDFLKRSYDVKIKEAQLDKEYYQKFKKVLSAEKIFKYLNAEKKFVKEVLEKDRDRRRD